jgi:hypothetical protein
LRLGTDYLLTRGDITNEIDFVTNHQFVHPW